MRVLFLVALDLSVWLCRWRRVLVGTVAVVLLFGAFGQGGCSPAPVSVELPSFPCGAFAPCAQPLVCQRGVCVYPSSQPIEASKEPVLDAGRESANEPPVIVTESPWTTELTPKEPTPSEPPLVPDRAPPEPPSVEIGPEPAPVCPSRCSQSSDCGPCGATYVCDGNLCKKPCRFQSDCTNGAKCRQNVCDPRCKNDIDCAGFDTICINQLCVTGCRKDRDCVGFDTICDASTNKCIKGCRNDDDCAGPGIICDDEDKKCVKGCRSDFDCPGVQTCSENECGD